MGEAFVYRRVGLLSHSESRFALDRVFRHCSDSAVGGMMMSV